MVSTSPIPFTPVTRQGGNDAADPVTADTAFANQVDANFTAINTWAGASVTSQRWAVSTNPVTLSSKFTIAVPDGNWHNEGRIAGDLRVLMLRLLYVGAGLTADAYGKIAMNTNSDVGTITETRYLPRYNASYLCFPVQLGATASGVVGALVGQMMIDFTGKLYLNGLSYANCTLPTNSVVSVTMYYILR